jgi:hypothetical protein
MNRKLYTFAGIVLFTLMMAGRAEAQHDCGEYCSVIYSACTQFCTLNGQNTTCMAIGGCTFWCSQTCDAGVSCSQWCWDDFTGFATTCGESIFYCENLVASNTEANAAANAEQCVASRGAPAEEAAGQSRADVNRRRSDDVGELSGPLAVQDIR